MPWHAPKHYHEITLGEAQLVRQPFLRRIPCGSLDLVVVVVQPDDVRISELDNLPCRSSNAAPHVEHSHSRLDVHDVCEVVFVTRNCLPERLAVRKPAEVERLSPAILVQVGREVVVAVTRDKQPSTGSSTPRALLSSEGSVFVPPRLSGCFRFYCCSFVVPVLEVLVDGQLLRLGVLLQHRHEPSALLRRLAMHRPVEGSIAYVILVFEGNGSHVGTTRLGSESGWDVRVLDESSSTEVVLVERVAVLNDEEPIHSNCNGQRFSNEIGISGTDLVPETSDPLFSHRPTSRWTQIMEDAPN